MSQFHCSKRRIRVSLQWQMTSVWLLQTLAATCPRLLISWPPAPDTECSLSQSEARILTRWPIRGQQLPGPCSPQSSPRAAYSYLRRRDLELETWGTLNWKPSGNCICLVSVIIWKDWVQDKKYIYCKRSWGLSVWLLQFGLTKGHLNRKLL